MAINIGLVFPKFTAVDITKIIPKVTPQAIDLIQKMLLWDPKFRPTARECLNHPYFNGMR
jgi:protein kinase